MDYKTNNLNSIVQCEETLIPEFPTLHFGSVDDDTYVFDATAFCEESKSEEIDFKVFQRINKRFINGIINVSGTDPTKLFYTNKDGHILMHHELTFLFIAFAIPEYAARFNGFLADIFSSGVAYSDRFIISMVSEKVPSEVLQEIINDRRKSEQ